MRPEVVNTLGKLPKPELERLLNSLSHDEALSILSDWRLWGLPYQLLPPGTWRRWVLRAGRGTGKTYSGARTTNEVAKDRKKIRTGEIVLWGRTHADVRHTMVEGPSGILATAPPDFRPKWEPGNMTLTWPNHVRARCISADKPEGGRGTNAAWVWADEWAHWPNFSKTWFEVIEPSLRIGWARAMLTTSPIAAKYVRELEEMEDTVVTTATLFDNPYLPKTVRDLLEDHYRGTRIGRQELLGEILETNEAALWDMATIDAHRVRTVPDNLRRIVVGVDPAVTANEDSDETGVIVAGIDGRGHGYVLADHTLKASPLKWGKMAVAAYKRYRADRVVVEVNNGGDLVVQNIRAVDPSVNVVSVRASRGKVTRAEPVAALYEKGLIHHVGGLEKLEDQLTTWSPEHDKSPDRLDALVWALHSLFLEPKKAGPLRAYL